MASRASRVGWLERALSIPAGRAATVFPMVALYFLVIGGAQLVKAPRSSLFLKHLGADNLGLVYIATAIVAGLLLSWYGRFADRLGARRLVLGTNLFLALNLAAFWGLFHLPWDGVAFGFYVWAKIYSVLTVSQFWLIGNFMFDSREAKRVFGLVGAGGITGGIVGGLGAAQLAPAIGTENLLLVAAGILVGATAMAAWVMRGLAALRPAAVVARAPAGTGAARLVRESPHLRAVATILVLIVCVSTVADWQLNKAVNLFIADADARTAFFGNYTALLSACSLLVQIFLTGFILRRFGIAVALLILPLGLLSGAVGLLLAPALWMAAYAKGTDGVLRYSLDQSTRELLFLPVPGAIKARVKPFIDVVVQRGGNALAGVAVLVLAKVLRVPFQYAGLLSIAAIAVWLSYVWVVRREYVGAIKRMIRVRDIQVDEMVVRQLDADSRRELLAAAGSPDPRAALFATELLRTTGEIVPDERARRRFQYPSLADVDQRAEAVRTMCARGEVSPEEAAKLVAESVPRVRAGAVAGLMQCDDAGCRRLAEAALADMARAEGPEGATVRREAALIVGVLPYGEATREALDRLLADPDLAVRRAAIAAAGQMGRREFVPALLTSLRTPLLREEVRLALLPMARRVAGQLCDVLCDPEERMEVRVQVARILAGVPAAHTVSLLVAALEDAEPEIRYHALKSLNRLRRDHPDLLPVSDLAERAIERELASLSAASSAARELEPLAANRPRGLLARALWERRDDAVERVTRSLGLVYPLSDVLHAYRAIATGDAGCRSGGIELLDNVLSPAHRRAVIPLLEGDGAPPGGQSGASAWRHDRWLSMCVTYSAARADRALARVAEGLPTLEAAMMSILERAEFLREVEFLSLVRTEYLAKIAAVMEEHTAESGRQLFAQDTTTDRTYVVVTGSVAAKRDGRVTFVSRRGDAVGALAVLDRRPHAFTATVTERSTLLSLGAEEFNDLLLDNPAIMQGLLGYLAGMVRDLAGRARHVGVSTTIS